MQARGETRDLKGYCSICVSRCGTINTVVDDTLVNVRADPSHPNGKAVCMKGRAAPELVHHPDRLLYPMRRTAPKGNNDPGWKRIGWDEALSTIASELSLIRCESGAESVVIGSTTPSGSLADSFEWVKRFAQIFGTPNFLGTTEICNWHKDDANVFTFGCSTPPGDHSNADVILLWGHNPANTWLSQAEAISRGRRKGAKLLVVDPRPTGLAREADLWMRVRPGTDGALAMGIANAMINGGYVDQTFVRKWTNAPLLVRPDTGRFLRERDIHQKARHNRFAVWDAKRSQVDFCGAQAGEDANIELNRTHEVHVFDENGAPKTVRCNAAYLAYVEALAPYTPDKVEEITGVPANEVLKAAEMLGPEQRVSYYSWSGVGQQNNATQTARALASLYALTGSFDRKGGNWRFTTPPANKVEDYNGFVPAHQRSKTIGLAERPLGPASTGQISIPDLCQAVLDKKPYAVRGLITFGLAPQTSNVDASRVERALRALEFHVHCDLFETPAARYADILLPSCSFAEREALRIGFDISQEAVEHVQLRPNFVKPRGESRPDYQIVMELASRLGMGERFFGGNIEAGWDYILAPLGLDTATMRRHPGGITKSVEQKERKYSLSDVEGKPFGFATETTRVELYSEQLHRRGYSPVPIYISPFEDNQVGQMGLKAYPYFLTSMKDGFYCHSQHRNLASLRKRSPYPVVELNPDLASEKGICEGDWVKISTASGSARLRAKLSTNLALDVIVASFGWWQACEDIGMAASPLKGELSSNFSNLMAANSRDPISGSAPLRALRCNVALDERVETRGWQAFRDFKVVAISDEAEGVRTVEMEAADGGAVPDYLPGQHVGFTVPALKNEVRFYSLIGNARLTHRRSYKIAVRHVFSIKPNGAAVEGLISGHIHRALEVGQFVSLGAPSGTFVLPLQSKQPVVLFAGGIGITPFLSYLETASALPKAPKILLFYANRSGRTHAFAKRITELQECTPGLEVVNCFDAPEGTRPQMTGVLTANVVSQDLIRDRARFYFCGPEAMMNSITDQLIARGVPRFDIFREMFSSPARQLIDSKKKFSVTFRKSNKTTEWSSDKGSLLSFAEECGVALPSGCRVGQCESCAVRLISGGIEYLGGNGPEDPGVCLACQAIPTSDIIVDA